MELKKCKVAIEVYQSYIHRIRKNLYFWKCSLFFWL